MVERRNSMKYLVIAILTISLVLIPNVAYAWPEPSDCPRICLVSDGDIGTFLGSRWPCWVAYAHTPTEIEVSVPPQLNPIQAQRWYMASPSARPYLARIYGVSDNVSVEYGANYNEIRQLWED